MRFLKHENATGIDVDERQRILNYLIYINAEYYYKSYDFDRAKRRYENELFKNNLSFPDINHYTLPLELKQRYEVIKKGCVKRIDFRKNKPWKYMIGSKWARSFRLKDLFVEFKPILTPEQDKFGLLSLDLAEPKKELDDNKKNK
jgi:hypothetical protein